MFSDWLYEGDNREIPRIVEAIISRAVWPERHVCHRNLIYIFALLMFVSSFLVWQALVLFPAGD